MNNYNQVASECRATKRLATKLTYLIQLLKQIRVICSLIKQNFWIIPTEGDDRPRQCICTNLFVVSNRPSAPVYLLLKEYK